MWTILQLARPLEKTFTRSRYRKVAAAASPRESIIAPRRTVSRWQSESGGRPQSARLAPFVRSELTRLHRRLTVTQRGAGTTDTVATFVFTLCLEPPQRQVLGRHACNVP